MPSRSDTSSPRPAPYRPAWRAPGAIALFCLLALAALAADLVTKELAFRSLLDDPHLDLQVEQHRMRGMSAKQMLHTIGRGGRIMPGVHLTLSTNPGVVFGLPMPRWAVAVATVVTVGLVGLFFATSPARAWGMHVAMALILAGALGNLYDRLFSRVALPGFPPIEREVRDFIDCSHIPLPFGLRYKWIFNVADVWLVAGVIVLMLYWLIVRPQPAAPAASGKGTSPSA